MPSLTRLAATITTFTSTLGSGIIYMPSGFNMIGYTYSVAILALLAAITGFTIYSIGYAAQRQGKKDISYPGIAGSFSRILGIAVILALLGSNIGTLIFISRKLVGNGQLVLSRALGSADTYEVIQFQRMCILGVLLLFGVLFFYHASVPVLTILSKISVSVVSLYAFLVFFYGIFRGFEISKLNNSPSDIQSGVARFIFALHCQFSFPSLYEEMIDKSASALLIVSSLSSLLTFFVYASTGFFGYKYAGNTIGNLDMLDVMYRIAEGKRNASLPEGDGPSGFSMDMTIANSLGALFLLVFFGAIVFSALPIVPILQGFVPIKDRKIGRLVSSLLLGAVILFACVPITLDIDKLLIIIAALFTNTLSFFFPAIFMIFSNKLASCASLASAVIAAASVFVGGHMMYGLIAPLFDK